MQYTPYGDSRQFTVMKILSRPFLPAQCYQPATSERNTSSHVKLKSAATFSLFIAVAVLLSSSKVLAAIDCATTPSTELTPQQVVKTVVEALRDNDESDAGIATVFCFASPQNRSQTGPLRRFTKMIRSGFSDMLNHAESYYEPMEIAENQAVQPVWLTSANGVEQGYLFRVGLQQTGPFEGMWMTEAVAPIQRNKGQGETSI